MSGKVNFWDWRNRVAEMLEGEFPDAFPRESEEEFLRLAAYWWYMDKAYQEELKVQDGLHNEDVPEKAKPVFLTKRMQVPNEADVAGDQENPGNQICETPYWVFAINQSYALGGMEDLVGRFNTEREAVECARVKARYYDFTEVVDVRVAHCRRSPFLVIDKADDEAEEQRFFPGLSIAEVNAIGENMIRALGASWFKCDKKAQG